MAKPKKKQTVKQTSEKKQTRRGKRYSKSFKLKVLDFVADHNKKHKRGGATAASKKFKISHITISSWQKKLGDEVGNGITSAQKGPVKIGNGKSADPFKKTLEKLSILHADKMKLLSKIEEIESQMEVLKKKL